MSELWQNTSCGSSFPYLVAPEGNLPLLQSEVLVFSKQFSTCILNIYSHPIVVTV